LKGLKCALLKPGDRREDDMDRRMRAGMVGLLAALLWAGLALSAARSVILLIGDGMGPEQVKAASIKFHDADGKLAMQGMSAKGSLTTRSANEEVTDSAAAATALATGFKTNNGVVAMSPDGKKLRTILEACRAAGKGTGVIATSSVTHATPACFTAHVMDRGNEFDIAEQQFKSKADIILGGGRGFFLERKGEAYLAIEVQDADGKKLLGVTDLVTWPQYVPLEHEFLAPRGSAKAYVWIWKGGALDAYADDFSLKESEDKKEVGPNLLASGDFEKGTLDGWNIWSGCEVAKDGNSNVLRVSGNKSGLDQTVTIEAGKSYAFTCRVRMADYYAGRKKVLPWNEAVKAGWQRVEKKEELAKAKGRRILGLFEEGAMENKEEEPTLAEMEGKALEVLGRKEKGFFLMVEGSQIDWACGGHDEEDFFRQMAWFDEAVAKALEFAKKKGDVLVIVLADHETGGMKVSGTDAKTLKVEFTAKGHTPVNVPLFVEGPGAEAFAGPHDNTDVPKLIAKDLKLKF